MSYEQHFWAAWLTMVIGALLSLSFKAPIEFVYLTLGSCLVTIAFITWLVPPERVDKKNL